MKKKKKKDQEKIKLKGAKPGKKLKRIQPGKMEKKAMVSRVLFTWSNCYFVTFLRQSLFLEIGGHQ